MQFQHGSLRTHGKMEIKFGSGRQAQRDWLLRGNASAGIVSKDNRRGRDHQCQIEIGRHDRLIAESRTSRAAM
jgi:hypothetical protein